MRKIFLLFSVILFNSFLLFSQQNPEWDAAKIKLKLEKLNTLGTVLYVAAHPDDENTGLLAYLANGKKYRTAYLSLTRGDGGQNLVGNEQGAYLGLMRTEELLAARHNDGAEQYFSHALDFGYSKTAKETFEFWGHQRILADVVWVIRKLRPDVIICRFPEDKRAGHGNHWASAVLAHEAFDVAGDPNKFPDQLKYVKPWQPKRILWNTYNFGRTNTTSSSQFRIDIGGYNALLGKGYGEIAAASRSMHKSQGFGRAPSYGEKIEYFKTIEGSKPKKSLMDSINTSWTRVKGGEAIQELIQKALKQYNVNQPAEIVPVLLKIRTAIKNSKNDYWRKQKLKEVNQLILSSTGILLDAYSKNAYVVAGQKVKIHTEKINRSSIPVTLKSVKIIGKEKKLNQKLNDNQSEEAEYSVEIPTDISISQPYWLQEKAAAGYYKIADQELVGLPLNPPSLIAEFTLDIDGEILQITRQIMYKYTDPIRGQVLDPLVVAPPVIANVDQEVYVYTSEQPQQIKIRIKAYKDNVEGAAHLDLPDNFSVKDNDKAFSLKNKGDEAVLYFTVLPSSAIQHSSSGEVRVHLKVGNKDYDRGIKVIAPHYIPTISVFPPSSAKLVAVQLKTTGHKIAYIMGAGDKVPQALEQMGYEVQLLSDKDLKNIDFHQFDAIITGIRAYNTRKNLKYAQKRLMDYVKQGGTLVTQYNKNRNLVMDDKNIGPYPFKITRNRTTDETADVKFLLPKDPILNKPNKITEKDFDNWIQERGLYYVDSVDSHYRKLISMQDPDEKSLDGSLVVADYGKGKYVYTSLVFFRELPAGIPGAFRLFANLISKK